MAERTPLLDVNVLLALADPRHVHHEAAHRWFAGVRAFATTPMTEAALVRLISNPNVGGESTATALQVLRDVRSLDGHQFVSDGSSLATSTIDVRSLGGHRQVTDFHLTNLAVQHELAFATFDGKLARALAERDRAHVTLIPL